RIAAPPLGTLLGSVISAMMKRARLRVPTIPVTSSLSGDKMMCMATMDDDKSTRRRYGNAIKVLSYFSAAWCGIVIVVVASFWIGNTGFTFWKELAEPGSNVGDFAGRLTGAGILGLFIVLVLGVSLGRFLLRALPPQFLKSSRRGRISTIGAVALCAVFV